MRPVLFYPHATIVDCGASRTSLAIFRRARNGRLRLEQYASVPLSAESGQEGNWLQKTSEALVLLRARVKPVGPITVVLPPHLTLMKMLSTPRVEKAKREKIISFEGQQSIPYPLTDVVWDRMIAGENSHGFNVLLCAAKLDVIDPLCGALAAAGLAPLVLLPSVLALAAGYRERQPEQALPTLLVNLGARSTTLLLMDQNGLQARSLTLGGGVADSAEPAQAAESFANRLVQEITRTLLYFGRPLSPENSLRLMLTGGAASLPGLAEVLAKQLNVTVHDFDAVGGSEVGSEAADFNREEHRATFTDVLGGAAMQLRAGQPTFNLLPPRLRQQAGRRRLRPRLAVAAGLAAALVVLAVMHQRKLLATAHAQNVALEHELAPLRASAARSQENQQKTSEAQRQRDAGRKIEEARNGWLHFLGEIQSRFVAAGEVWLERMQLAEASVDHEPSSRTTGQPLRIAFSGLMRIKAGSAPSGSNEHLQRIRSLLEDIATLPAVAAVERERFEPASSGQLRFEFVVVLKEPVSL